MNSKYIFIIGLLTINLISFYLLFSGVLKIKKVFSKEEMEAISFFSMGLWLNLVGFILVQRR